MSAKSTTGEKMVRRFMIMLKMLYSGQGLSTNELCKEFDISLRTLQRDIPRLQDYCDIELEKAKTKIIISLVESMRTAHLALVT